MRFVPFVVVTEVTSGMRYHPPPRGRYPRAGTPPSDVALPATTVNAASDDRIAYGTWSNFARGRITLEAEPTPTSRNTGRSVLNMMGFRAVPDKLVPVPIV